MNELKSIAQSIRSLSIDAIESANSGHPGLPLGAAELAAILYAKILKHNPKNPNWIDRDRFLLSAGHGSMLLYSILHISGYNITIDDIKQFRQLGSKCPGHPEYGHTPGIEATTGPLGQGVAMAVGMAVAEKMLSAKFNTEKHKIVDHYTYALVGEGCLMEGISSEASSFAGHNKLGKLIVYYDANKITIDGSTDISFTENVQKRYEAYGWHVQSASMYSFEEIDTATENAKNDKRPSLIILNSKIGKGAPTVEGTSKAHGAPLGPEGIKLAKQNLGLLSDKTFYVAPEAYNYFEKKQTQFQEKEKNWQELFENWSKENPEKRKEWNYSFENAGTSAELIKSVEFPVYEDSEVIATRAASKKALNEFAKVLPNLVGGSADLEGSNSVSMSDAGYFSPDCPTGRNIHFGIREFSMAAISNGIQLHGGLRSFCSTFLVFSDYLKPAIRLSALMKQPVIYVFTHDSIFVGEDGPTHQPIEFIATLRSIPNCLVLRPSDAEETSIAWQMALENKTGPTCLILTRQRLPILPKTDTDRKAKISKPAYIIQNASDKPDLTVLATGSEVSLAIEAAKQVPSKKVRIISVLSKEMLELQPAEIQEKLIGGKKHDLRIITAEAGVRQGWGSWTKDLSDCFSIETFGASAPGKDVAKHLNFTAEALANLIKK
ncbi:MAG: transketolase [Treponema sp.]|nr:MAG: transketolase [Treponema sp.]